jgi:hypothetical protein
LGKDLSHEAAPAHTSKHKTRANTAAEKEKQRRGGEAQDHARQHQAAGCDLNLPLQFHRLLVIDM